MHRIWTWTVLLVCLALIPLWASDWVTHSGTFQRTGWQKDETRISKDSVSNLQRIETLLAAIDKPSLGGMKPKFYPLKYTKRQPLSSKMLSLLQRYRSHHARLISETK